MDHTDDIEKWKIRRMIRKLETMRGNGTSIVSLIIPPNDQIHKYQSMLTKELGAANNIKSRVNRLGVLSAITSTQQRMKLYNTVPPNGLIIYSGTVTLDNNKEKKITIDFEPFKPINRSIYHCGSTFHTELLRDLLQSDSKHGYIIIDGSGCLYATISGNHKDVLLKIDVDLPKKHKKGGQSSVRFARLREESIANYIRKCAENAKYQFIKDNKVIVDTLIIAGSADMKDLLKNSDLLDQRIKRKIIGTVDISYGGEAGLNEAITQSAGVIGDLKLIKEKELISEYMTHIAKDSGKYCFGLRDTIYALELGAVEQLIIWEELPILLWKYEQDDGTIIMIHGDPRYEDIDEITELHRDKRLIEEVLYSEWLADNYSTYGTKLSMVSDQSDCGNQFVKGFGGIGGILRYATEMPDEYCSE